MSAPARTPQPAPEPMPALTPPAVRRGLVDVTLYQGQNVAFHSGYVELDDEIGHEQHVYLRPGMGQNSAAHVVLHWTPLLRLPGHWSLVRALVLVNGCPLNWGTTGPVTAVCLTPHPMVFPTSVTPMFWPDLEQPQDERRAPQVVSREWFLTLRSEGRW